MAQDSSSTTFYETLLAPYSQLGRQQIASVMRTSRRKQEPNFEPCKNIAAAPRGKAAAEPIQVGGQYLRDLGVLHFSGFVRRQVIWPSLNIPRYRG